MWQVGIGENMKDSIAAALKPYGYEWIVSATGIAGPGSMIVVFAGLGDFYTACLTHDDQVVWVMTCGGQDVDANTDECNALHRQTRDLYRLPPRMTEEELLRGLQDLIPPAGNENPDSGSAKQYCVSGFVADLKDPGADARSVSVSAPGSSLDREGP